MSVFLSQYDGYLLSLSIMVTADCPGLPMVTRSGIELDMILRLNVSLLSNMLSSVIGISSGTFVFPVGNVTLYGPES